MQNKLQRNDNQIFKESVDYFLNNQCDLVFIRTLFMINSLFIGFILLFLIYLLMNFSTINKKIVYEQINLNSINIDKYLTDNLNENNKEATNQNLEIIRLRQDYRDHLIEILITEYIYAREKYFDSNNFFKQNLFVENHSTKDVLNQYMQKLSNSDKIFYNNQTFAFDKIDEIQRNVKILEFKKIFEDEYEVTIEINDLNKQNLNKFLKRLKVKYIFNQDLEEDILKLNTQEELFKLVKFKIAQYEEKNNFSIKS